MSSTREVDSEKREGIKNDKDGFHFGDWKDVNRKSVVRNGRGQSGGRDKSGAHMQEGGEEGPGRWESTGMRKGWSNGGSGLSLHPYSASPESPSDPVSSLSSPPSALAVCPARFSN